MNINIQSKVTQQATSEQLDAIAHDYLGVKQSLDDESYGCREGYTVNLPSKITATDSVYSDTQEALVEKGVTVNASTVYQRILDPEVLSVLLEKMDASAILNNKILESGWKALTAIDDWFYGVEGIKRLDLIGTSLASMKYVTSVGHASLTARVIILPQTLSFVAYNSLGDYGRSNANIQAMIIEEGTSTLRIEAHFLTGWNALKLCDIPARWNISAYSSYKFNDMTTGLCNLVCRVVTPSAIDHNHANAFKNVFVPEESVDLYKATSGWSTYASNIHTIGGDEWQTAMQSLATGEGKTLNSIHREFPDYADVDWSYEYIDYLIYGVEPPTA